MKKLFSTLGMMAMVSLCLFTSCKDEDVTAANVNATVNDTQVQVAEATALANAQADALAAAQAAAVATGATVTQDTSTGVITTTETDGSYSETTVESTYTYTVNGVECSTTEEVEAALRALPAGTVATVVATLVQTTTTVEYNADGTKKAEQPDPVVESKSKESTVEIPEVGQTKTETIELPVSVSTEQTADVNIGLSVTESGSTHGGGEATTK